MICLILYAKIVSRETAGNILLNIEGALLQPFQSLQKQYFIWGSSIDMGFQKSFFLAFLQYPWRRRYGMRRLWYADFISSLSHSRIIFSSAKMNRLNKLAHYLLVA